MKRFVDLGHGMPSVTRLGLATRGNTNPSAADVQLALDQGINYWNWCGHDDGMSEAIRQLGSRRSEVVIATQIAVSDWSSRSMGRELDNTLARLKTDYLDIVTLYYVESESEWSAITRNEGAIRALEDAKHSGKLRAIGLTTHQRPLAAEWSKTRLLDLLMVRYNAAHRNAEAQIFPVSEELGLPIVCFTCLRWGALLKPTPLDPEGFDVPSAPEWYRFVLSNPAVSVALMAPNNRKELIENLSLLDDWQEVDSQQAQAMKSHGDRVRKTAGPFP